MGIDGIGKKGGPNGVAPPSNETAKPVGDGVRFDPTQAAGASATGQAQGLAPLERLRAGEIDLPRYLDLKVDEATAHLKGLPSDDLAMIRDVLREQLTSDPGLVALVKQATRDA